MQHYERTYYVDLIDRKVNRAFFQTVLDAYNRCDDREQVCFYISTEGGKTHWAHAVNDIMRKHAHKTKIIFTDRVQSCGIFIFNEALRMGIATICFPIDIMVHKQHSEVEVFGHKKYMNDAHEHIVNSLAHDNKQSEKEPFYLALAKEKKELYQQGHDIYMTGEDVKKYIDRMCEFVEKELKHLK